MKRKMAFGVLVFFLVLQAQTIFAADNYRDFNNAIEEGNFSKAERILKNNANKWSIKDQESCWDVLSYSKVNNSTALRAAQLLYQYKINFGDHTINKYLWYDIRSEELYRYLISIGMPIGDGAVSQAIFRSCTDNFVQFLLEKRGTVNQRDLRSAAENRRWALLPDLINKSTEDFINYRLTREEYATWKVSAPYDPSTSKTALMFAAQYGQLRIVRMLVEKGARVNLRADDGATAASLAYDNGEMDIYDYLKANGARDFEPRQVTQQPTQPAAPAQSTTNVYVQPTAPAQSDPAQPATPTLQTGRYAWANSGQNMTMTLNNIGIVDVYVNNSWSSAWQGTYRINGNQLVITVAIALGDYASLKGKVFAYTITSSTSFSGGGENWVRTGSY